jgi:hypothetical protein
MYGVVITIERHSPTALDPISSALITTFGKALFSSLQKPKTSQNSLLHRILRHMHEPLNIDENKN